MKIQLNNIELFYEVSGQGSPLILVHGNGENHKIFNKAVALLSQKHTCYVLDSRNHGQSTKTKTISYTDMADDVITFIEKLGLTNVNYYGFSDGGIIGLLCAIKKTDIFSKMIISGANLSPSGVKENVVKIIKIFSWIFRKNINLKMMLKEPNIPVSDLSKITFPTLVLAGENDVIKQEHTQLIANNIKGAKLMILPKEGHGSYIVHKTKIADLISQFID
ncbi:MAG: alpha/beta hydrolase [Alphaproteobacteria bacterium]|nr:alpha/beta hydrolase [Alphaproteobacteria bacterium]